MIVPITKRTFENHKIDGCWGIYKHSYACPSSFRALQELQIVEKNFPEVDIFMIDVLRQKEYSQEILMQYSVEHQSPQFLLIKKGVVLLILNHDTIKRNTIEDMLLLNILDK